MTTIILARHGETDWNRERRVQGQADPPLNEAGREQAAELARTLEAEAEAPSAIYSSDLRRARETAAIVAEALRLPVRTDPRLREIDVGEWSGLAVDDIEARFPAGFARWRNREGPGWDTGESYDDLGRRVVAALTAIAAEHQGERVLVVTHGGAIRSIDARVRGVSEIEARRHTSPIANCSLTALAVENGRMRWLD